VSAEYIERLRSRDLLSTEHFHAFADAPAPDNERELEAAE
jgi:hypothetical protein